VARRKLHRSLCCNPSRIQDLAYLEVKIRHSATLPIRVYYFDLAACGVSARFMEAYTLNCAALRSAFCLASPSGNCFASLARASACSSKCSAVKNMTLFLLRMPGLIFVSTNCHLTKREGRIATGRIQLAFDGAAACAPQRPMLVPRS